MGIVRPMIFAGVMVGAMTIGLGATAMAAQSAVVRGTIESVGSTTMAVKTYAGRTTTVALTPGTKYAWILASSLDHLQKGDFIGAAARGPEDALVAQEVVIFPNAMRGAGEGHYPWSMPAAVARADAGGGQSAAAPSVGGPPVQGTMTNGTISAASSLSGAPPVEGTMTNGTLAIAHATPNGRRITVTYDRGQKVQILVPAHAPVVRFELAEKTIVKAGEKVFVHATKAASGAALTANFVAVGKDGLMPPM